MMSLMATSLPFSVPTNSSSCSTVSTAVFLRGRLQYVSFLKTRIPYKSITVQSVTSRSSPVSNIDRDQVVQVQTTPLLHVLRAGGAEESPAHLRPRAGQEHSGQLLPETCLTVFKQLVGLVHHQPLHTAWEENMSVVEISETSESLHHTTLSTTMSTNCLK